MNAITTPDPDLLARETLRLLGPAPDNWVPVHPGITHDVLVIGGGQSGIAYAFALHRAGIASTSVIDSAPGPAASAWRLRARMNKLRTAKNLVGPELGLPALSFQAWYEARHGAAAYAALDRIPRPAWADYVDWLRDFLAVPVRWQTQLLSITPVDDGPVPHLRVELQDGHGERHVETARKIVLATGVSGSGAPFIPPVLQAAADAGLVAHTSSAIDFAALRGKTVAVVGAAASAFDAAAVALEAGAQAVHLFARRDHIAATPVARTRGYPGLYDNYHSLPDALRWQQALRFRRAGSTPPADALQRVLQFPHFHLHLSAPWRTATVVDQQVQADAGEHALPRFDFVIAGTGYSVAPQLRPELAALAPHIRRWRDQYTPAATERDDELANAPYLGAGLELQEKIPGTAPWLRHIHVHNPGGFASVGVPLGDVPSMRRDIPAAVARISHDLLQADLALHATRINADVPPDFGPELYASALWQGQREAA